jgi:hypothetical protein
MLNFTASEYWMPLSWARRLLLPCLHPEMADAHIQHRPLSKSTRTVSYAARFLLPLATASRNRFADFNLVGNQLLHGFRQKHFTKPRIALGAGLYGLLEIPGQGHRFSPDSLRGLRCPLGADMSGVECKPEATGL